MDWNEKNWSTAIGFGIITLLILRIYDAWLWAFIKFTEYKTRD